MAYRLEDDFYKLFQHRHGNVDVQEARNGSLYREKPGVSAVKRPLRLVFVVLL